MIECIYLVLAGILLVLAVVLFFTAEKLARENRFRRYCKRDHDLPCVQQEDLKLTLKLIVRLLTIATVAELLVDVCVFQDRHSPADWLTLLPSAVTLYLVWFIIGLYRKWKQSTEV